MHTQGFQQSPHRLGVGVRWQLKERQSGVWVAVREWSNLVTSFGLTQIASAPSGQYTPPQYLVIDQAYTQMSAQANIGDTTVQLYGNPVFGTDTQLVLSVGLAAQETVTFTSKSGTGPYTFTLSTGLLNVHAINDPVVRGVTVNDTMASVVWEAAYDPTYNPNMRLFLTAAYSPGSAQATMQFFMAGSTATNLFFAHVGLADRQAIGDANTNLHNYAPLGYNHNNTNDLEVDVTYTLQNY